MTWVKALPSCVDERRPLEVAAKYAAPFRPRDGRFEAVVSALHGETTAKVWWHSERPDRPHPPGIIPIRRCVTVRILTSELSLHPGESVQLAGWVHRRRVLKSVAFIVLRDRGGLAQIVFEDPTDVADLGEETVISVRGVAKANPAAPGGVELCAPIVEALSGAVELPAVELFRPELNAALPTILDNAAITLRHPSRRAVFEVSAAVTAGFRRSLDRLSFFEIHTPKIVASATESGANVFAIDYFGRQAYLAQSPQFFKQTMVGVFERVYEVGPVFRAEPHDTARHLAEYVSLDAEMGFITDHRDVMGVLRAVIAEVVASVAAAPAAAHLRLNLPAVPAEIPVVHFSEALALAGGNPEEPDLSPADERAVGEWALREHGSDFVFVEGYPMAKRPFYTHSDPERSRYSNSFDLLFRGLEIVTGGQRLHRYSDYVGALIERGESVEAYSDYLGSFRGGMPPHGGFAIGLERLVARLVGAANIRETTLFPRDLHRLTP